MKLENFTALAVDPGKRCGWACSDGTGGAVDHERPADRKLAATPRHMLLAHRYRRWLSGLVTWTRPAVLVLERQQMGRGGGEVTLGLRMVALELAHGERLATAEIWPGQWQGWARRELGWAKRRDGDEDDARAMLAWWLAHFSSTEGDFLVDGASKIA